MIAPRSAMAAVALKLLAESLTGTSPGQPGVFTCPCCRAVSHHPDDAANGYCARCRWWTADPDLGPAHLAAPCPHRTAASGEAAGGIS